MTEENNRSAPSEQTSDNAALRDHTYDGIQEYDNPMPSWWLWLFWASVIFAPAYILGVHVFDIIPSYTDDLESGQQELADLREAHSSGTEAFQVTPESMQAFIGVQDQIDAGRETFATYCQMCHGDAGQGLIGPNLTDHYWIHGNRDEDLFSVISNGVPEKGMTPWSGVLQPEERAQVIAFIRSIEGSNPPGAKDPQGELYDES